MNKEILKVVDLLDENKINWSWFNSYLVINLDYINNIIKIKDKLRNIKGVLVTKENDFIKIREVLK